MRQRIVAFARRVGTPNTCSATREKCEGPGRHPPAFGQHPHRAPVPSWPVPSEISPQERSALPSQRFPRNASSDPLNSSSAQAYCPAMSRLINQLTPNPRLQRTRSAPLRSPLSRQPFGDGHVGLSRLLRNTVNVLAALLLVATFAKGLGDAESVTRDVESQLRLMKRVAFSVGGAHSDIEIASDWTAIYFIENGADGMVLKRVSFNDGIPHIVARFVSTFIGRVFSIPGDSDRLIIAKLYGDATAPWDLVFMSLTSREETRIDVGQEGSDGRVVMSPAGQLFGLGTRHQCVMVMDRRLCGVNAFSVVDAKNGKVAWSLPLPKEKVSSQAWENSSPSDSRSEILVAGKAK